MHFETFGTHSCNSQSILCVSLARSHFVVALAEQWSAHVPVTWNYGGKVVGKAARVDAGIPRSKPTGRVAPPVSDRVRISLEEAL